MDRKRNGQKKRDKTNVTSTQKDTQVVWGYSVPVPPMTPLVLFVIKVS